MAAAFPLSWPAGWPRSHLCRGARDLQLQILAAFGLIETNTDEAFDRRSRELGCQ